MSPYDKHYCNVHCLYGQHVHDVMAFDHTPDKWPGQVTVEGQDPQWTLA